MNNKKKGSSFEKEWATILKKDGYFVHLTDSKTGAQPFDIIACKNHRAKAYECKTVKGYKFDLKRVENNQYYTIKKHYDNIPIIFVFKTDSGDYFYKDGREIINAIDKGLKSIDLREEKECSL